MSSKNGVGIIVDEEWKKNVVAIHRIGDRIISLKMVVGEETINVINVYAPQVGAASHIKKQFWEEFEALIQGIPILEKVFICGDLNGHVGRKAGQYTQAHDGFGFGEVNNEGQSIIDFCMAYDLKIVNTCFKKREEHLITYKSGANRSQIDFFLVRNSNRRICTNCKVIPGDGVTTQHRPLVLDVRMTFKRPRRREVLQPRIRWWQLKGEKMRNFINRLANECVWEKQGCANEMGNEMTVMVRKVAKEILGESKGIIRSDKETWWWNDKVQEKIKLKK